jgi:hypothetical protein
MSETNRDELPFVVTLKIVRKARKASQSIDPSIDRANKAWNTAQFGMIQDRQYEAEFGFDKYWGEKMRQQRAGERMNNYPSPQQKTRSLEEIIYWWKSNNPYMNGSGAEQSALTGNLEGGNDECQSDVMGMGSEH